MQVLESTQNWEPPSQAQGPTGTRRESEKCPESDVPSALLRNHVQLRLFHGNRPSEKKKRYQPYWRQHYSETSLGTCPRSVWDTFSTLQGHSRDTFSTLRSPGPRHSVGLPETPRFSGTLRGTLPETLRARRARETPVAGWGGGCRNTILKLLWGRSLLFF